MLPKTQILRTMQKRKLTYQEELEQHTMAVQYVQDSIANSLFSYTKFLLLKISIGLQ